MTNTTKKLIALAAVAGVMAGAWVRAASGDKSPIKDVMQKYHKAPKGTDPVCKKASDGKASKEDIKGLVAGYKVLTTSKPPQGDAASWKEKTAKLYAAAQALEKGAPDAVAQYKAAVNCKACHSVHKPE